MELHAVSQLIAGQSGLQTRGEASDRDSPARGKRNKLMMVGTVTVMSSLVVGSLLLVFAGLDKFYPGVANLIPLIIGVSGVLLFGGAALVVYSSFLPKEPGGGDSSIRKLRAQKGATTKQQLNRLPESFASVTDNTTELFDPVDSNNRAPKTAPRSQ